MRNESLMITDTDTYSSWSYNLSSSSIYELPKHLLEIELRDRIKVTGSNSKQIINRTSEIKTYLGTIVENIQSLYPYFSFNIMCSK